MSVSISWGQNSTDGTSLPPGLHSQSFGPIFYIRQCIDCSCCSLFDRLWPFPSPRCGFLFCRGLLRSNFLVPQFIAPVRPADVSVLQSCCSFSSICLISCEAQYVQPQIRALVYSNPAMSWSPLLALAAFLLLQNFVDFFPSNLVPVCLWSPPTLRWFVSPATSRTTSLSSWRTAKWRRTPFSGVSPLRLLGATWV